VLGFGASGVTFLPLTPTRTSRTVRAAATTANVKIDLAPPLEPSSSVIGLKAMAISPDLVLSGKHFRQPAHFRKEALTTPGTQHQAARG
jgi:hypothetical protein